MTKYVLREAYVWQGRRGYQYIAIRNWRLPCEELDAARHFAIDEATAFRGIRATFQAVPLERAIREESLRGQPELDPHPGYMTKCTVENGELCPVLPIRSRLADRAADTLARVASLVGKLIVRR